MLDSRVEVAPDATLQSYMDYWGSVVHAFDLHHPHRDLTVAGRSVVETRSPSIPGAGKEPAAADEWRTWEELNDEGLRDAFAEFLSPTRYVPSIHACRRSRST